MVDELEEDSIGNLYATIKGTTDDRILLDAHADEIGFQVIFIENEGFIRIAAVGGQNPRILPGARVIIHSSKGGQIIGVIGEKPIHHLSADDRKKTTEISKLFVDIGISSKSEVEKYVDLGDFETLAQTALRFPNSTLATGKAFDDRAGCWVLIRVLQMLKNQINTHGRIKSTITAVFSAQEEIGVRGAGVAAYHTNPNLAIILEVTHAMDYPGGAKNEYGDVKLGGGPTIPLGPNVYPKFGKQAIEVAKKERIPFQARALPTPASNNARIIQITREGIPTGLVVIPLRYMHTAIECLDLRDLNWTAQLVWKFILSN